ncbi:MAG: OmpH family outer membrane protein [Bryobacteraceae bacterium]
MKCLPAMLLIVIFAAGVFAQTASQPSKVAIINLQGAISSTQDGQKAAAELQERYEPKRKALEKQQNEIQALRDQLSRGSNTMSDEAKLALQRDIDQKTKAFNRDTEDAQADFQMDQDRLLQGFFEKMQVVIDKYARDNNYALVLDISSQQSPVVYATNSIDITSDVIALYDKNSPAPAAAKPAPPAKAPAAAPVKK